MAVALVSPLLTPRQLPPGQHVLTRGVTAARSVDGHDVLMIDGSARPDDLIEAVRQARLGRIDLVIATSGSRSAGALVALVHERFEVTDTWAPAGHQVPQARVVEPIEGTIGSLVLVEDVNGELVFIES